MVEKKLLFGVTPSPFHAWLATDYASRGGAPAWLARAAHHPVMKEIDKVENFAYVRLWFVEENKEEDGDARHCVREFGFLFELTWAYWVKERILSLGLLT